MSLWGMNDGKAVAGSITVTAANSTVVGSGTTFTNFAVNDFLHVGKNDYIITAIANATVMTVAAGDSEGLTGAQSNSDYYVSNKPIFISTTPTMDANDVYGVSQTEMLYANTADTEADSVPHAGWVHRIDKGNGRFYYEVLVAGSSMTGDAGDDTKLPEEN